MVLGISRDTSAAPDYQSLKPAEYDQSSNADVYRSQVSYQDLAESSRHGRTHFVGDEPVDNTASDSGYVGSPTPFRRLVDELQHDDMNVKYYEVMPESPAQLLEQQQYHQEQQQQQQQKKERRSTELPKEASKDHLTVASDAIDLFERNRRSLDNVCCAKLMNWYIR